MAKGHRMVRPATKLPASMPFGLIWRFRCHLAFCLLSYGATNLWTELRWTWGRYPAPPPM